MFQFRNLEKCYTNTSFQPATTYEFKTKNKKRREHEQPKRHIGKALRPPQPPASAPTPNRPTPTLTPTPSISGTYSF